MVIPISFAAARPLDWKGNYLVVSFVPLLLRCAITLYSRTPSTCIHASRPAGVTSNIDSFFPLS